MKKLLSLFLVSVLFVTGCGAKTTEDNKGATQKPTDNKDTTSDIKLGGEITGDLKVSCYDSIFYLPYLKEAGKKFEAKYPGTKINIESFSKLPEMQNIKNDDGTVTQVIKAENDEQSKKDYINKINTEIMSNSGADLYAMDVLPFYKYADSSQIENLNDYIKADTTFNKSDYHENILKAMEYKGGQYIFPTEYSLNYLAYDKSLFDENLITELNKKNVHTFDELINIAKTAFDTINKDKDKPIRMFDFFNSEMMFKTEFNLSYSKFVDIENKKANFIDGEFVKLLEKPKLYADQGYIKPESTEKMDTFVMQNDEQVFYKYKKQYSLLGDVYKNENMSFIGGGTSNTDNDKPAGLVSNEQGQVSSTYTQAYSINSNSKNKNLAWEFMKFLASEEMQSSFTLDLPINKAAFDKKAKQAITGELYQKSDSNAPKTEDRALTDDEKKAYDEYISILNELSNNLNVHFIDDIVINDVIFNEVNNYFSGKKSAEEVAKFIQNKVELYLSE